MKKFWKFISTDDRTGLRSKTSVIQMVSFISILFVSLFTGVIISLDALGIIDPLSSSGLDMLKEVFKHQMEIFMVTTVGYLGNRFIKEKYGKADLAEPEDDKVERVEI
jgi:hypothetical protein